MITGRNLIRHELIGLNVKIIDSSNKFHVGIKGMVVDETKNLLIIETKKGLKRVQKKGTKFVFTIPNGRKFKVNGTRIIARPEDRIKLRVKKW